MHRNRIPHGLAALAFVACAALSTLVAKDAAAGTAVELDVQGLVDRAELVLEARVASAECGIDERGRIETRYALQVARTFLGEARSVRSVSLPGGVLPGGRGLVIAGVPRLEPGEDVVLFLSRESRAGLRMPVGLSQGSLRLVRAADGKKVLLRDSAGVDLVDASGNAVAPRASSVKRFDYGAFAARVEAAVLDRAAREARGERTEGRR